MWVKRITPLLLSVFQNFEWTHIILFCFLVIRFECKTVARKFSMGGFTFVQGT